MNESDNFSLLCQCLRNSGNRKKHTAQLEKMMHKEQPDWYAVVRLADRDYVTTVLYYQLKQKGLLHLLPEDIQGLLAQIYELNSKRNRIIFDEINYLASLLNPAGIEPIFLKGSAGLLMEIHAAPGLRIMNDVDFLLDEKDLPKCVEIMESKGYYPMETANLSEDFFEDFYHLKPLIHKKHNIRFEIHKQLDMEYNPQMTNKDMVTQSVQVKVKGGVVRVPSKTHFVLHNILHHQIFNRGLFTEKVPLYQIYDLYAIREKFDQQINWKTVSDFFQGHSYPDALYYPLGLLRKNFKQQPPAAIHFLPVRMLLIQGKRWYSRITTS